MKIAIRKGRVVDPATAFDQQADVFVAAGKIVGIGAAPTDWHSNREINAEGCVVNLLDQKLWNPNPDHFSYTLSKAALQSATTLLAQALAPQVRVCGVAPGLTLGSSLIDPDALEALERMQPLLRLPAIDDIARAVRFMMECRSITGATLLVDAGQHLVREPRDFAFLVPRATQTPGA